MIEKAIKRAAVTVGARGVLFLDGQEVGGVVVSGWDGGWTYGRFEPGDGFPAFAPIFGRWSLLMHADEREPLSPAASEELRAAEQHMDTVRARVYFPDHGAWHDAVGLNIDGDLIEWNEL